MKISNEFKIGLLTILSICLLFGGISFLKNGSFFSQDKYIYSIFKNVAGINKGTFIYANGLVIGQIEDIHPLEENFSDFLITLSLKVKINIPINSTISVSEKLLGDNIIEMKLGNSSNYITNGDTIKMKEGSNFMNSLGSVKQQADSLIQSFLLTINNINLLLNQDNMHSIKRILQNVADISANVNQISKNTRSLLAKEQNHIHDIVLNIQKISENMLTYQPAMDSIINNIQNISQKINGINIDQDMKKIEYILDQFSIAMKNINEGNGNISKLLNDTIFYQRMNDNLYSLNTLLDDIRTNPKRYVHVSIFGNKKIDKIKPLTKPINDTLKK
ncbi:MAG: MlaD family protein [Chitinophagaceae bacterium]